MILAVLLVIVISNDSNEKRALLLYLFYGKPSVFHIFHLYIFPEANITIFILQVRKWRLREGK